MEHITLEQLAREAGLSATAKDDRSIGVSLPLISQPDDIVVVVARLRQMAESLSRS